MVEIDEPIRRRKLYQDVMDRVIGLIRSEGYRPGDSLPSERELMERYAVGRPAVREALQNLEWMGLITISHGERARLADPNFGTLMGHIALVTNHILQNSERSLEELKQARLLYEITIVRLAAERATPADVERLQARLVAHQESLPDKSRFVELDMLFHKEVAAISGNSIFPAFTEALIGWLAEFYRVLVRLPGSEDLTLAEHQRIIDAIAANDPAAAERAMSDHLTRANALYRKFEKN